MRTSKWLRHNPSQGPAKRKLARGRDVPSLSRQRTQDRRRRPVVALTVVVVELALPSSRLDWAARKMAGWADTCAVLRRIRSVCR